MFGVFFAISSASLGFVANILRCCAFDLNGMVYRETLPVSRMMSTTMSTAARSPQTNAGMVNDLSSVAPVDARQEVGTRLLLEVELCVVRCLDGSGS
jgi:hypothetical protein